MMSTTPTIVQQAFAPDHEHELTLEATLVLEAINCHYLTGGTPGLRDAALVWLAMTALPDLKEAHRKGAVDACVEAWAADKRPADLLALQDAIASAVQAAFAPAGEESADDSASDFLEKKEAPDAAGG